MEINKPEYIVYVNVLQVHSYRVVGMLRGHTVYPDMLPVMLYGKMGYRQVTPVVGDT